MTIVKRLVKGSALTHAELDGNFTDLDTRMKTVEGSTPLAIAGGQFVADGAGGGEYIRIPGFEQYEDSRETAVAPSQSLADSVRQAFVVNGVAAIISKPPSDQVNPMWDVATNKVKPIAAFDTYILRINFTAANYSGPNPYMTMDLDIGGAIGVITAKTIPLLKGGSAEAITWEIPVYAGATFLANGGEIGLTYFGGTDCDIYNASIFIRRETKNYV